MSWEAGGVRIVNAIREMRPGDWDATEGEVRNGILLMKMAKRRRVCCGQMLERVVEVRRGSLTWGLWRCTRCEAAYSIGPKLPPTWVSSLARACIELYCSYHAAVAAAYEPRDQS